MSQNFTLSQETKSNSFKNTESTIDKIAVDLLKLNTLNGVQKRNSSTFSKMSENKTSPTMSKISQFETRTSVISPKRSIILTDIEAQLLRYRFQYFI